MDNNMPRLGKALRGEKSRYERLHIYFVQGEFRATYEIYRFLVSLSPLDICEANKITGYIDTSRF